ncbi:MAG TPA: hypothetical protein VL117_04295, partial [Thermoleophilia bacterium]|nr:hypothetical protein [Thermoleophilia bacterium]
MATAAAALAAAAVAIACALLPAPALATGNVIIAVNTPTTLKGLEAAARGERVRMARLEAEMNVVRGQYDAAVAQLTAVDQQLSQTRLRLAQSQGALDRQNAVLGARLAAMYKMGSFSILDVLAGSASFTQAQAQVTFFRRLALQDQRDDTDLARLNAQVAELASALADERVAAQS